MLENSTSESDDMLDEQQHNQQLIRIQTRVDSNNNKNQRLTTKGSSQPRRMALRKTRGDFLIERSIHLYTLHSDILELKTFNQRIKTDDFRKNPIIFTIIAQHELTLKREIIELILADSRRTHQNRVKEYEKERQIFLEKNRQHINEERAR